MFNQFRYRFICLSVLVALLLTFPVQAAERIYLNYSLFGFSVTVDQLETFAQTGQQEGRLGQILGRFSPERQAQIRGALQARYAVDPVVIDRFGYTSPGERLFQELGELAQSAARLNGGRGLRSAAVLAAADPEGVSLLSFLQQFPTDIRIDLRRVLQFGQRVTDILQQTRQTVATLNQQTQQAASRFDLSQWPDLRQPGPVRYRKQPFSFQDTARQRMLAGDLYLPEDTLKDTSEDTSEVIPEIAPSALPVIVMSNGLGAGRDRFDEIAPHLASHGFAIVTLDHPGSDRQRLREFYAGLHRENFEAREYLDRPQDITFVLDQLEQLNQTQLGNQLNLQQVGIFGYSFGGSTALSLAGAEIDFEFLETDCQTETGLVNISLLYQCRALDLPRDRVSFKDDRIKAAFVFVPFGKSLFGSAGIAKANIPIFWEVTDLDILTPLVVEQVPAFAALTGPDKYFSLTAGLPHARVTYDALSQLTNVTTPWETLKQIAHNYQNALSLAFFKVYVAGDPQYQPYLTASYAQALTQAPYSLSLVQSLQPD